MNERVTGQNNEDLRSADLVVQWHNDLNYVGIGLEADSSKPNHHIIDQMYGNVPAQTQIGQILNSRMNEFGWDIREFNTDEEGSTHPDEAEWFNKLGRAILDSVTAVEPATGMWTWFDRGAINRLIRLLRKARDNAFGRDE